MTVDHVIARGWFPANTPPVAKWKVPACRPCNNHYSAIERDLIGRIAFCLDRNDPNVGPIVERALRAIDPDAGKGTKDTTHRRKRKEALRTEFGTISSKDALGVLPYFLDSFDEGSRTGVRIPAASLDGLVEKWVRGIHFIEMDKVVPADYDVSVQHVDEETRAEILAMIGKHAIVIQKGPGVEVKIVHVEEAGEFITVYLFNIWNTFRCTASVERTNSQ